MVFRVVASLLLLLALQACGPSDRSGGRKEAEPGTGCTAGEQAVALRHARRLQAWKGPGYYRVWVHPADSSAPPLSYLLLDSSAVLDAACLKGQRVIRVPVQRAALVSTTHAALFAALDCRERVAGMSWADNLYDEGLRARYRQGQIAELSAEGNLDLERILALEPDLVMTYMTADPEYGQFRKMEQLGLPVMANAEFAELHPLGQAEWLRLGGWLTGRERQADSLFGLVESRYQSLAQRATGTSSSPTVFSGLDYQGAWTVPRGGSFAAAYLRDAGARYVWAAEAGTGSLSLDFEQVLLGASEAEVWVNPGAARSLAELEAFNPRLVNFRAWKTGRVYNNDARMSASGGNDYWESAVVRPDRVLEDLIRIFHGQNGPLRPDPDSLTYYRLLP
jgi:iron complex transport system substrate-binding protein